MVDSVDLEQTRQQIKHLQRELASMRDAICEAIEAKGIGVRDLLSKITEMPIIEEQDQEYFMQRADLLRESCSVRSVLDRLRFQWDYLHPDIYGNLIEDFSLTDIRPTFEIYQRELDLFLDKTLLNDFCTVEGHGKKIIKPPPGFVEITTAHVWSHPVYLRQVETFRRQWSDHYSLK